MLSYRDMTFCVSSDCCNTKCPRKLTTKIMDDAKEFGLPVAYSDFANNCPDYTQRRIDSDNTE